MMFIAAIFERIFQEKGELINFDFPFVSCNFGPSLLPSIFWGYHTTYILSQFLDHSEGAATEREWWLV